MVRDIISRTAFAAAVLISSTAIANPSEGSQAGSQAPNGGASPADSPAGGGSGSKVIPTTSLPIGQGDLVIKPVPEAKAGTSAAKGKTADAKEPAPQKATAPTVSRSAMETAREASLRRTAQRLGLNYDTMLENEPQQGPVDEDPVDGGEEPGGDGGANSSAKELRRARFRRAAQLIIKGATNEQLQTIVSAVSPDPKVAVALSVLRRISALAKAGPAEAADEVKSAVEHDEAKQNPDELLAALQLELQAQKEKKELELLVARQNVEIEKLKSQQAVARAELALNTARKAAEDTERRLIEAEQARQIAPQPAPAP